MVVKFLAKQLRKSEAHNSLSFPCIMVQFLMKFDFLEHSVQVLTS